MGSILLDDRFAHRRVVSGWERYTTELAKIPSDQDFRKFSEVSKLFQKDSRLLAEISGFLEFPRLARQAELIHFPASPPLAWKYSSSKSVLLTIHDLTWWKFPELATRAGKYFYKSGAEDLIKSGCRIVTVTQTMRNEIIDFFNIDSGRVHVVYPGAKIQETSVNVNYSEKAFILFVGTIEPRKNLSLLIDSFLKSKIQSNYDLVIAGRIGWDKNFKIPNKIRFVENPSNRELSQLYADCSAVVNTSIYEGFGLPLVEGLGIGKDLIVPDLPVFREVLSTFPNFFESRSQASLIHCLDQFAPSINAETAKKFVRDRYDWEKFRDSFRRLYSEISSMP